VRRAASSGLKLAAIIVLIAAPARATPIVEITTTGPYEVRPGEAYYYDTTVTNLSTEGEYIWLNNLTIILPSDPAAGDWSVVAPLPDVDDPPPFGWEPPIDYTVAPRNTVHIASCTLLEVRPDSFHCTYYETVREWELGIFKWPFFFLGYEERTTYFTTHTIPEPAGVSLGALGLLGVGICARRKIRARLASGKRTN